jgi:hypothetical protein
MQIRKLAIFSPDDCLSFVTSSAVTRHHIEVLAGQIPLWRYYALERRKAAQPRELSWANFSYCWDSVQQVCNFLHQYRNHCVLFCLSSSEHVCIPPPLPSLLAGGGLGPSNGATLMTRSACQPYDKSVRQHIK